MKIGVKKKAYKASTTTIRIILDAIGDGLTQRDAAVLAGICEDTLSLWKRRDSDFSEQIRQKEIEFKRKQVGNITRAAERSWQASAWLLERKYRDEYALKTKDDRDMSDDLKEALKKVSELFPDKTN